MKMTIIVSILIVSFASVVLSGVIPRAVPSGVIPKAVLSGVIPGVALSGVIPEAALEHELLEYEHTSFA